MCTLVRIIIIITENQPTHAHTHKFTTPTRFFSFTWMFIYDQFFYILKFNYICSIKKTHTHTPTQMIIIGKKFEKKWKIFFLAKSKLLMNE